MSRPRLLDLFCGAGGAAVGYLRAGFEVVGVDLSPQRHYPFKFHQADALTFPLDGFDVVHASPPCQAYSITKHTHRVAHPDLLGPTREVLEASGLPYVIENVVGAPMRADVMLCGADLCNPVIDDDGTTLFLRRHRLFESNLPLFDLGDCRCADLKGRGWKIGGVYGGGSRDRHWAENVRHGGYTPKKSVAEALMGIEWMTMAELHQAIPPAYTTFIGFQLWHHLERRTRRLAVAP